jgi:hypothetical protein
MKPQNQTPVAVVALVGILTALFGIYYSGISVFAALGGRFSDLVVRQKLAYFYPAFYGMSGICIVCYLLLLMSGVNLLRAQLRWGWLLTGVLAFEVIYFFGVGALWLFPAIGMSVGAATGVANGGLMAQFLILFPLWAPVVLWWAMRKVEHEASGN